MKRIVRLVFNSIPIIVSDIFVRGIGINRIDPPDPQIGGTATHQTWMRDRSPAGNVLLSPIITGTATP
jgi:hypothetical protein